MSDIRWDILSPVDVGASLQQGFATGMALAKTAQTKAALAGYVQHPDDPQALNALAYYDPTTAGNLETLRSNRTDRALKTAKLAATQRIGAQYASGDTEGARASALATGDFDLAKTLGELDKVDQGKLADFYKTAAPLAYRLKSLPADQRQAYLDSARPLLHAHGITDDMINQLDVTDDKQLDVYITGGQTVDQLISQGKVHWVPIPEGASMAAFDEMGKPVGKGNPYAAGNAPPAAGTSPEPHPTNPGNLRKPGSREFQTFGSVADGIKAQEAQLGRYMGRGLNTISSVVETYAPRESKGGDNTDAQVNNYINYVSKRLGVDPNKPLPPDAVPQLAAAMREFETGHRASGAMMAASVGAPAHIATKEDYDRLPSGAPYIAPDGSRRVKA